MMDARQLIGIACLVCVVFIWNFSSYLVKTVYSNFRGPFFLTFFGNSLFALYLPGLLVFRRYCRKHSGTNADNYSILGHSEIEKTPADGTTSTLVPHTWRSSFHSLKSRKILHASFVIAPLWFVSNFLYNLSLLETSVSSSTMLSGTSCIFTFCLAFYWKRENFSWVKVSAICLTLLGMGMVVITDSNENNDRGTCAYSGLAKKHNSTSKSDVSNDIAPSLLGDVFALVAAVFYALYIVSIDSRMGDSESFEDLALFLGYVGLVGCLCCLPIVCILAVLGVENLSELSFDTIVMIFCKGLFDNVLSDLLWAKSVILTSPTISTIGINMTIPLSVISDWFCGKKLMFAHYFGAICMTAGFITINLKKRKERDIQAGIDDKNDGDSDSYDPSIDNTMVET